MSKMTGVGKVNAENMMIIDDIKNNTICTRHLSSSIAEPKKF